MRSHNVNRSCVCFMRHVLKAIPIGGIPSPSKLPGFNLHCLLTTQLQPQPPLQPLQHPLKYPLPQPSPCPSLIPAPAPAPSHPIVGCQSRQRVHALVLKWKPVHVQNIPIISCMSLIANLPLIIDMEKLTLNNTTQHQMWGGVEGQRGAHISRRENMLTHGCADKSGILSTCTATLRSHHWKSVCTVAAWVCVACVCACACACALEMGECRL